MLTLMARILQRPRSLFRSTVAVDGPDAMMATASLRQSGHLVGLTAADVTGASLGTEADAIDGPTGCAARSLPAAAAARPKAAGSRQTRTATSAGIARTRAASFGAAVRANAGAAAAAGRTRAT